MHRNVAVMAAMAWLLGGTLPASQALAICNFVVNGDFETGTIDPFAVVTSVPGYESGQATVVQNFCGLSNPYAGQHMAVLSPDTYISTLLAYGGLQLQSGTYTLSFYYDLVSLNEGTIPATDFGDLYFGTQLIATEAIQDAPGGTYTDTGWKYHSSTITLDADATAAFFGFGLRNDALTGGASQQRA